MAQNEVNKIVSDLDKVLSRIRSLADVKNITLKLNLGKSYKQLDEFTSKVRETAELLRELGRNQGSTDVAKKARESFKSLHTVVKDIVKDTKQIATELGNVAKAAKTAAEAGRNTQAGRQSAPSTGGTTPVTPTGTNAQQLAQQQQALRNAQTLTEILRRQREELRQGSLAAKSWADWFRVVIGTTRDLQRETQGATSNISRFVQVARAASAIAPQTNIFNTLSNAVNGLTGNLANLIYWQARWYATKTLIFGIVGGFKESVQTFIEFDQQLKNIQSISNATQEDMDTLGTKIKEVASTTKFSIRDVAEATTTLAQVGFTVQQIVATLPSVANLATATLTNLNTVVGLVTTAIRAFDYELGKATEVTDIFANAVSNSRLTIEGIATAFNYVGPVASQVGLTLGDTAAVMGLLSNKGIQFSTIGTSLRTLFGSLSAPTERFLKVLRRVGLSAEDVNPSLRNMEDILRDLKRSNLTTADIFAGLDRRAAGTLAALIQDGAEGFTAMRDGIETLGATSRKAQIQLTGISQIIENIKQNIDLFYNTIIEKSPATNIIISSFERLRTQLVNFNSLAEDAPEAFQSIVSSLGNTISNAATILGGVFATRFLLTILNGVTLGMSIFTGGWGAVAKVGITALAGALGFTFSNTLIKSATDNIKVLSKQSTLELSKSINENLTKSAEANKAGLAFANIQKQITDGTIEEQQARSRLLDLINESFEKLDKTTLSITDISKVRFGNMEELSEVSGRIVQSFSETALAAQRTADALAIQKAILDSAKYEDTYKKARQELEKLQNSLNSISAFNINTILEAGPSKFSQGKDPGLIAFSNNLANVKRLLADAGDLRDELGEGGVIDFIFTGPDGREQTQSIKLNEIVNDAKTSLESLRTFIKERNIDGSYNLTISANIDPKLRDLIEKGRPLFDSNSKILFEKSAKNFFENAMSAAVQESIFQINKDKQLSINPSFDFSQIQENFRIAGLKLRDELLTQLANVKDIEGFSNKEDFVDFILNKLGYYEAARIGTTRVLSQILTELDNTFDTGTQQLINRFAGLTTNLEKVLPSLKLEGTSLADSLFPIEATQSLTEAERKITSLDVTLKSQAARLKELNKEYKDLSTAAAQDITSTDEQIAKVRKLELEIGLLTAAYEENRDVLEELTREKQVLQTRLDYFKKFGSVGKTYLSQFKSSLSDIDTTFTSTSQAVEAFAAQTSDVVSRLFESVQKGNKNQVAEILSENSSLLQLILKDTYTQLADAAKDTSTAFDASTVNILAKINDTARLAFTTLAVKATETETIIKARVKNTNESLLQLVGGFNSVSDAVKVLDNEIKTKLSLSKFTANLAQQTEEFRRGVVAGLENTGSAIQRQLDLLQTTQGIDVELSLKIKEEEYIQQQLDITQKAANTMREELIEKAGGAEAFSRQTELYIAEQEQRIHSILGTSVHETEGFIGKNAELAKQLHDDLKQNFDSIAANQQRITLEQNEAYKTLLAQTEEYRARQLIIAAESAELRRQRQILTEQLGEQNKYVNTTLQLITVEEERKRALAAQLKNLEDQVANAQRLREFNEQFEFSEQFERVANLKFNFLTSDQLNNFQQMTDETTALKEQADLVRQKMSLLNEEQRAYIALSEESYDARSEREKVLAQIQNSRSSLERSKLQARFLLINEITDAENKINTLVEERNNLKDDDSAEAQKQKDAIVEAINNEKIRITAAKNRALQLAATTEEEIYGLEQSNIELTKQIALLDVLKERLLGMKTPINGLKDGFIKFIKEIKTVADVISDATHSLLRGIVDQTSDILSKTLFAVKDHNAQIKAERDEQLRQQSVSYEEDLFKLRQRLILGEIDQAQHQQALVNLNAQGAKRRYEIERDYEQSRKDTWDESKEAFRKFARSWAQELVKAAQKVIAELVIVWLFQRLTGLAPDTGAKQVAIPGQATPATINTRSGVVFGFAKGGLIPAYATGGTIARRAEGGPLDVSPGGHLYGGVPNKDSILAWTMPGEYVVKKSAVDTYGSDFFHKLNAERIDPRKLPRFAQGGQVSAPRDNTKSTGPDESRQIEQKQDIVIYNFIDPRSLPRQPSKDDIVNTIQLDVIQNGRSIQTIRERLRG